MRSAILQDNLDRADKVYNNINGRIDKYISENNIDAPENDHYKPVWQPERERETLNLAESGMPYYGRSVLGQILAG